MSTVTHLPNLLQQLFETDANVLGRTSGFIERQREWTGAQFAQTLVFGWMENPNASLSELQQMAQTCGCQVSVKSIATRLNEPQATRLMQRLLEHSLALAQPGTPRQSLPPLPFKRIVLRDSTQVSLPLALVNEWRGGGNQHRSRAGMKIETRYDWQQGSLGFSLHPAVTNDRKLPLIGVEAGDLVVQDSGFVSVAGCRQIEQHAAFWLARLSAQMGIVDGRGTYWHLAAFLQHAAQDKPVDDWVALTHQAHPIRLLALPLPDEVVQLRQERLRADCQRRYGRSPTPDALTLCRWCVLATNAPSDLLSIEQAFFLYRSRWQIELLFKLWKQHGSLDEWRTQQPQRIQTEIFAKLLMLLVQQWLLVETCWQFQDRSLVKAVRCLRRQLVRLVMRLTQPHLVRELLSELAEGMGVCRVTHRRKRPAFFQLCEVWCDLS